MYENQTTIDSVLLIQSFYRCYNARKLFKTRGISKITANFQTQFKLVFLISKVKMVMKRKNVASELLQTEREYTNNLQTLIQVNF